MLKAADLFTRICVLLNESGYTGWPRLWREYSSLVTLNRPIQKGDAITLKHEITEAHKWVESVPRITGSVKRELLTLLGLGGRVTRVTNISKVNEQKNQDGTLIDRYHSLIGSTKDKPSGSPTVSHGGDRLIGAPPKSKRSQFVRAATPNRATKTTTRKGSSRKTVASGKFRS